MSVQPLILEEPDGYDDKGREGVFRLQTAICPAIILILAGLLVTCKFFPSHLAALANTQAQHIKFIKKDYPEVNSSDTPSKTPKTLNSASNYNKTTVEQRFKDRLLIYKKRCQKYLKFEEPYFSQAEKRQMLGINSQFQMMREHKGPSDANLSNYLQFVIYVRSSDFVLCAPPKTGTSNWQRSLTALEYQDYYNNSLFRGLPITIQKIANEVSPQTLFGLLSRLLYGTSAKANRKGLTAGESVSQILLDKKVTKVLHVRHPFLRLHSAWQDKFTNKFDLDHDLRITKMFKHYDRIIQNFEDNENYPREGNARVSFYAFLQFIAKSYGLVKGVKNGWNGHWGRYTMICYPCILDYDYITKLETIEDDSRYLFDRQDFSEKIGYFPPAYNNSDSIDEVRSMYKRLPEKLVDTLYHLYYWDYQLYGYSQDF